MLIISIECPTHKWCFLHGAQVECPALGRLRSPAVGHDCMSQASDSVLGGCWLVSYLFCALRWVHNLSWPIWQFQRWSRSIRTAATCQHHYIFQGEGERREGGRERSFSLKPIVFVCNHSTEVQKFSSYWQESKFHFYVCNYITSAVI